jgi:purine nucleoside phosphorylase
MLATVGADLVGMSTAGETIALRHLGVRVAGVSLVTNRAAGLASRLARRGLRSVVPRRRHRDLPQRAPACGRRRDASQDSP